MAKKHQFLGDRYKVRGASSQDGHGRSRPDVLVNVGSIGERDIVVEAFIVKSREHRRFDMKSTPYCQPWCDEHDQEENECRTLRFLYDQDDQEPEVPPVDVPPEILALREAFQQAGGIPEADSFTLDASYSQEGGSVQVKLEILDVDAEWAPLVDPDTRKLYTDLEGLKEIYQAIGKFIQEAESQN